MRNWWLVVVFGIFVGIFAGCASAGENDGSGVQEATESEKAEEPATQADKPPVNTLKWTTASEVDNFGFDIYRGLSEDGEFEKITAEPLAGAGTTDEPQSYVFVDEAIDPSRDYYYYIESISLGGVRETFSPIIRSPAKRPADADKD
jgi:hypothetical protein